MATNRTTKYPTFIGLMLAIVLVGGGLSQVAAETPQWLVSAERIVFVGDSITHAGHYVSMIEARFRALKLESVPELINVGLPSETCSGLSEQDHPFPRPDVHERLDRLLAATRPDVVIACYGMNDGIYYPFDEERFAAYQKGVNRLIEKVRATGAKLVLMTPPPFDPVPLRDRDVLRPAGADKYAWFAVYEDYDTVLRQYAEWILKQGDRVEMVIDLHSPVTSALAEARIGNPKYTMAADGVHLNVAGHKILAGAILKAWGFDAEAEAAGPLLDLVGQRQLLMRDAWLSHIGHKRPGMKAGLALGDAQRLAAEIDAQITEHLPDQN